MIVAAITVAVSRHAVHRQRSGGIANLEWPSRWEFPVGTIVVAAVLIVLTVCLPFRVRSYVSPTASGFIFGLGLGCSGMTRQDKVLNFLDVAGTWDPSLMLVMGCGLCASAPSFLYAEKEDRKPLCGAHKDCAFEKPAKRGDYGSLVLGSCAFGLGWGLIGICPGPRCGWGHAVPLARRIRACFRFGLPRDLCQLVGHGLGSGRLEAAAVNTLCS